MYCKINAQMNDGEFNCVICCYECIKQATCENSCKNHPSKCGIKESKSYVAEDDNV